MINIGSKKREINNKHKKEGFMQGVITLMFSQVLIKILGLVYTLYLTNRQGFGDKGNGICASGYQIYALLLTISSIGVPSAISKLVSERVAVGDNKGAHRIFKIAFATFAVIGLVGSLLLFFGANVIANQWLQIPDAEMTLVALSPAIFFKILIALFKAFSSSVPKPSSIYILSIFLPPACLSLPRRRCATPLAPPLLSYPRPAAHVL